MRKIIFTMFFFASLTTYSQQKETNSANKELSASKKSLEKGYIITKNNEYKSGLLLVGAKNDNSEYIAFLKFKNAPAVKLTKADMMGFGYDNVVYELIPYKNDSVFMQRLNKQEPYIYYYNTPEIKEFYLKKGSSIQLLPEDKLDLIADLKNTLSECEAIKDQIKYASYTKNSLSNILFLYSVCSNKKLPFFKFGVHAGGKISNISINNESINTFYSDGPMLSLSEISFKQGFGYNIGVNFDALFLKDKLNWTFHSELEFSKVKYIYTGETQVINYWLYPELDGKELDFEMNYYSANLFFRYNTLRKKASLYTDFGPVISINTVNSKIGSTDIDLNLNKLMIGVGAGIGIDYPIFGTHSLNIGLKVNYLLSAGGEEYVKYKVWNAGFHVGFDL